MRLKKGDVEEIITNYDIGELTELKHKGVYFSDVYFITTTKGKYVLKVVLDENYPSSNLEFINRIQDLLAEKLHQEKIFVQTKEGKTFVKYKNKIGSFESRVKAFLDGYQSMNELDDLEKEVLYHYIRMHLLHSKNNKYYDDFMDHYPTNDSFKKNMGFKK